MQKGSLKPWQIGVFVVAVGAVVFGVYTLMTSGKSVVDTDLIYIDVQSGDLFTYHNSQTAVVPATNPDTGNASLLPVEKTPTGYQLRKRFMGALDLVPVPATAIVNMETGEVKVSGKASRSLKKLGGGKIKLDDQPVPDPAPPAGEGGSGN